MRKIWKWILGMSLIMLLVACDGAQNAQNAPAAPEPTETMEDAPAPAAPTEPAPTATPQPVITGTDGFPWWSDAVFYEIFVRSFYDSDGDGVGDINGVIEKLDYLNDGDPATTDDLGITGIWLMPIMESPSYHGYDVVDYLTVDQEYGTNDDFRRLMEEAHARGIRIIVDLVMNHTSVEHPWFVESRDAGSDLRDWYMWAESDPGWRGPTGQKVWHTTADGAYYALFWDGMPDLNLTNPDVTAAIYEAARFWLEEMNADGFRLDAIKHLVEDGQIQEHSNSTHEWLEGFYAFYKGVDPNAFAIGEAWSENTQTVAAYVGDEVDAAFEFGLAQDILNSTKVGISKIFAETQANVVENYPNGQYGVFITNHDQNRVMSQLNGEEGKARMAASILLTAPGVPFIYYGEEIGMMGTKPDEDIRLPMQWCSDNGRSVCFTSGEPWRDPAPDFETRSVALQETDSDSLFNHYRALIQLRNEHPALRVGDWTLVDSNPGRIYAFLRQSEAETLLVVMNLSDRAVSDYTLALETGPLTAVATANLIFGSGSITPPTLNDAGGFTDYMPLPELPGHSTYVIKLAP